MTEAGEIAPGTPLQKRVLMVAITASFIAFLDGFVVNLALPAISRDLGGGLIIQQWVVDAYLLTLGALILVAGSLSDHFGRTRVMEWGLAGFAVTSVLCGLAWSGELLVVSRALQGVAGALLVPSSLAMIVNFYSGPAQSRAIGVWSGWTSGAAIVAPLVGGAAVDLISWRLIFFINVIPLAAIWPVLLKVRQQDAAGTGAEHIDFLGAALAIIGLGGPVFALIEQGSLGWENPRVWAPMAIGLIALTAFVFHERSTTAPMLPMSLFRIRNFGWGNIATTAIYAGLTYGFFVLGIYLQQVAGMGATLAGVLLLPSTLVLMLASTYFGGLAGKFGARWFMTAGPMLCAAGFLMMLAVEQPLDYVNQVLPGLLVFGVGLAVTVAPLTSAVLGAVPTESAGIGSAINNAVARVAGLVCIAFAGIVTGQEMSTQGLHRSLVVIAVLLLIGALASAAGIRNAPAEGSTAEVAREVSPPA